MTKGPTNEAGRGAKDLATLTFVYRNCDNTHKHKWHEIIFEIVILPKVEKRGVCEGRVCALRRSCEG